MDATKIKESDRPSDQELVAAFQQMRQELQSTSAKIGELEHECEEHMYTPLLHCDLLRSVLIDGV